MAEALIGSTGFVGGNLLRQRSFDQTFHSTDIEQIRGRHYELLVCAGAPAEKWRANQEPEKDQASLDRLMGCLATVTVKKVVLISTIDVYPAPVDVDERTPIDPAAGQPYGCHRFALERFLSARFPTLVVRLPALFGPGLKKNLVFDLLHGKPTDAVSGESVFQFYDLGRLWGDVTTALASDLELVNFATWGLEVRELAREAFGIEYPTRPGATVARYRMRTVHAAAFGGADGYLESKAATLDRLRRFVAASGWRR